MVYDGFSCNLNWKSDCFEVLNRIGCIAVSFIYQRQLGLAPDKRVVVFSNHTSATCSSCWYYWGMSFNEQRRGGGRVEMEWDRVDTSSHITVPCAVFGTHMEPLQIPFQHFSISYFTACLNEASDNFKLNLRYSQIYNPPVLLLL